MTSAMTRRPMQLLLKLSFSNIRPVKRSFPGISMESQGGLAEIIEIPITPLMSGLESEYLHMNGGKLIV